MSSRAQCRRKAYFFVLDRLRHLETGKSGQPVQDVAGQILLDDLVNLKNGTADPSPELLATLRFFLNDTVAAGEFEEYLVKPFQNG